MVSFQDLKDKPNAFLSLTGYTLDGFSHLFPHFSSCFLDFMQTHTLNGKPRKNRSYKPYKNSRFASEEDMLVFILIYVRDVPKQALLGELYGMPQPVVNRWIHLLLPILNKALEKLGEASSQETTQASMGDAYEVSAQS